MEENYGMTEIEKEESNLPMVIDDEPEEDGMSTGAAMALGSLLTIGVFAGIKFATKKWQKHKEKKSLLEKKKRAIDMEPAEEDRFEDESEEETEEE